MKLLINSAALALFTMSAFAATENVVVDFATLAGNNPSEAFANLIASKTPVVIKFYRTTCPPCVASEPAYKQMAQEFKDKATFVSLNTDKYGSIASQLQIRTVPTLMVFANKTKLARVTGCTAPKLAEVATAITNYLTAQR